jgi:small GTP-binding protein
MENRNLIKIATVGDKCVGKTVILEKYTNNIIKKDYYPTVGVDFFSIDFTKETKLHLWDLSGNDIYRSLVNVYLQDCNGIILVYDISCRKSFENIEKWLDLYTRVNNNNFYGLVVGNKSDLYFKRKVGYLEGKYFATKNNCKFIENSSFGESKIDIDNFVSQIIDRDTNSITKLDNFDLADEVKIKSSWCCK